MIKHKYTVSVLLGLLIASFLPVLAIGAYSSDDFYALRSQESLSLPHSETVAFSHKSTSGAHDILSRRTFAFRADKDSVVSILFSNARSGESANILTASVFSDNGEKICEEQTENVQGTSHIEYISAYGGVYFLVLESRAAVAGEYSCDLSISASSDFDKNSIYAFPHKKEYKPSSHKALSFSELFSNEKYESADKYKVSVFEFSHEAGSVFSYKLNVKDNSLSPYAVVMSYDGEVYTPHISNKGEGYACGDAIELFYSANSYLFVFTDGNFSLEADMLFHSEYKITELGDGYSGTVDTSATSLMYDQAKIDALASAFPFADIKNREVMFFSFTNAQSSVVSYLCDRDEHKYLTLVSDRQGLSPYSTYPMRSYGEYCSEISPCKYCYSAYINDGESFYLCYTGTGSQTYIEVQSAPTHTTEFTPNEKYKPQDVIAHMPIQNIYSDSEIYEKLGIEKDSPDLMKTDGYVMEDEQGVRYYFSHDSELIVPDVDGNIKLYATVECVYNSNTESQRTEHLSFFISDLSSDRGFLSPIINDMVDYVKENPVSGTVIIIASAACVGAVALFTVFYVAKRKKVKATKSQSAVNEASGNGDE